MSYAPGRRAAWFVPGAALAAALHAGAAPPPEVHRGDPVFGDATSGAGITHVNQCGASKTEDKGWIIEYMGTGAGWLDYDGDGHLDLYLLNGSTLERPPGAGEPNQLYRGDGRGHFKDVTKASGTGDRGWAFGVAVGDIDNDGDPDLYVTNYGPSVLYVNRGDGTFEDVTARAGVGHGSWSTSAAFFDMEGDGDLDLYVGRYVDFDKNTTPRRGSPRAEPPFCVFRGLQVFCGPRGLEPAQNVIYRNNGDGTFTDVTRASGMWLERPRYTMGVVTLDYDNDGDQDVFDANDSVVNCLWRNRGNGTFEELGLQTLVALDAAGNPQGCMGTDAADYDGDGWLDLVTTNFSHDLTTIYHNAQGKYFVDESAHAGMAAGLMMLKWGTALEDFDQDGDLDLFVANGHVHPEVEGAGIGTSYAQTNQLFVNERGRFRDASAASGKALALARSWRGAAFADYDEDGDVDVLVTSMNDAPQLLRNDTSPRGHYLKLRLVGRKSNRDAVGARVALSAGGRTMIRERKGGGSYLSASDGTLHFGLGAATKADVVKVRWPSGRQSERHDVAADQTLTIEEP